MNLDRGLAAAVRGALWQYEPLRTTQARIGVQADADGHIILTGNVRSAVMRAMAARIAAGVPGVNGVENRLLGDAEIEGLVSRELGAEAGRLFTNRIHLESRLGTVYLTGVVTAPDTAAAEAALAATLERVRQLPEVTQVIADIQVVLAADGVEAAPAATAPDEGASSGADDAVIQERLRVWRERTAAGG